MEWGFSVDPASIDGSTNLLTEIAAFLYEGRLDRDVGTLCRAANLEEELRKAVEQIARFADEQYLDLALLVTALSTKLKQTKQEYLAADAAAQEQLNRVLAFGYYVAPQDRATTI